MNARVCIKGMIFVKILVKTPHMKQKIMLGLFSTLTAFFAQAQSGNVQDLPPIDELGTGMFMGHQGGLYPNGSNHMPATFYADAVEMARSVQPLDKNGKPDPNGRIGLIALGASTVAMFSKGLEEQVPGAQGVNKEIVFVNCGIGGQDLSDIMDPAANFWSVIDSRVKEAGMSLDQVQVLWFQEDNLRNRDNDFDLRVNKLTDEFTYMVRFCKERYPNLKLFYVSGRHTTEFMPADAKDKHREPKAYLNGWVCKKLIENQINGDPQLAYKGQNAVAPLILWGPYFWTQGAKPRSDGYAVSPDLFSNDGVHPNEKGIDRIAGDLVRFWQTDPVSQLWFLENPSEPGATAGDALAVEPYMHMVINSTEVQTIAYNGIDPEFNFMLLRDSVVIIKKQLNREEQVRVEVKEPGTYKFLIADATHAYAGKISVDSALQVTLIKEMADTKPGKTIDPNAPAWVVNGANKLPKLKRVLDPHTNVKCVISDGGKEVLVIEDVLNKHTDLNAALDRGEYTISFYDEQGKQIKLPEEFKSMVRIKY